MVDPPPGQQAQAPATALSTVSDFNQVLARDPTLVPATVVNLLPEPTSARCSAPTRRSVEFSATDTIATAVVAGSRRRFRPWPPVLVTRTSCTVVAWSGVETGAPAIGG